MCRVPARFLAEAQDKKAREWWSEPEPQHGRGSASQCPRVAVAEVEVADCLLEQGPSNSSRHRRDALRDFVDIQSVARVGIESVEIGHELRQEIEAWL